ncbi:MAG: hypothetical protein LBU60_03570 [Clostridiales bacterium]|jgi:hypothetical protein|nr:hypothetical protein [Clostridiales bacterium]
MELKQNIYKVTCELGCCANFADFSIGFENLSLDYNIHVCSACLKQIYELVKNNIIQTQFHIQMPNNFEMNVMQGATLKTVPDEIVANELEIKPFEETVQGKPKSKQGKSNANRNRFITSI